jgi:protein ImuA
MVDSTLTIARLRRRLERLEPRRDAAPAGLFTTGHGLIDQELGGGLARGRLHEIFAAEDDAGSGLGAAALFCLRAERDKSNRDSRTQDRPLLWLRTDAAEKRAGRLHATGLGELGLDPASLLLGLLPDEPALLRTAADATRCSELGALLVECWGPMRGLDLTASRRLLLAAEASGVTVFVLRIAAEPSVSAAETRWWARPAMSAALEADTPGLPTFTLELQRRRAGPPAGPWRVEWNRDRLCFQEPERLLVPDAESPLSRPVLPAAAGGTPATEPLRRAL